MGCISRHYHLILLMTEFDSNYIKGGIGGNTTIEKSQIIVKLKKGEYGNPKGLRFNYCPPNIENATVFTLEYTVKFPDDFDPVKGGKLPGFNGDEFCSRVMFRRNDGTNQNRFGAEMYLHGPRQIDGDYNKMPGFKANDKYGDSLYSYYYWFEKGVENNLLFSIKLNDVGMANGTILLKINQITHKYERYTFRTKDSTSVSSILFCMFFGGSNESWAPTKDEIIIFDNIRTTFS
eukprot:NODE_246_length_12992_cov_0.264407.p6 type:complete len:234 gc:universal NODE_246_length_12992_cov_0.264407:8120-8821(+)